jgi:hypothetical protein
MRNGTACTAALAFTLLTQRCARVERCILACGTHALNRPRKGREKVAKRPRYTVRRRPETLVQTISGIKSARLRGYSKSPTIECSMPANL